MEALSRLCPAPPVLVAACPGPPPAERDEPALHCTASRCSTIPAHPPFRQRTGSICTFGPHTTLGPFHAQQTRAFLSLRPWCHILARSPGFPKTRVCSVRRGRPPPAKTGAQDPCWKRTGRGDMPFCHWPDSCPFLCCSRHGIEQACARQGGCFLGANGRERENQQRREKVRVLFLWFVRTRTSRSKSRRRLTARNAHVVVRGGGGSRRMYVCNLTMSPSLS